MTDTLPAGRIAVVGLDCRFPGAADHEEFWANLKQGKESITAVTDDVSALSRLARTPGYVDRAATIEDADLFDAGFFYLSSREAERMDPQLRLFLQTAWSALEHSGHDSQSYPGRIGVFAGSLPSSYLLANVLTGEAGFDGDLDRMRADMSTSMGNDSNYLATRTSYHLNLTGPSISVQTACSTSLVAIHVAAQSLLAGECDAALAGGVSIRFPQQAGYVAEPGGIGSPDGIVRPFDAAANGTVFGNGVGAVVLKRLEDAIADGDTIWAVMLGSAIGNDGADRAGFAAPGVSGQAATLAEALSVADVDPATVTHIEAHGTGTRMGDPIEMEALRQIYGAAGIEAGCAVGSVKGNIGHLSVAAGIAGFIKTVLMLRHREIVPTLHFRGWNPDCAAEGTRFWVPTGVSAWTPPGGLRRCAVSSTGMGGTNAHVLLEEAPEARAPGPGRPLVVLPVSAKSPAALDEASRRLAAHLRGSDQSLADVGYTLATARRTFNYRTAVVAADAASAAEILENGDPRRAHHDSGQPADRPVVFMFPGQGAQYAGMGREWYRHEPEFRAALDECADLMDPDIDLRKILFGAEYSPGDAATMAELSRTWVTQPVMFAVCYALARQWMAWGVRPAAMIGHSIGEYVAACLAGVMTLPDAVRLVTARGLLMDALPAGQMAAVMLTPAELAPYLTDQVELAAVNEPAVCTVAGPAQSLREVLTALAADGVSTRKLNTSSAFHSAMMEPATAPLGALVATVKLGAPQTPFISNVTGTWITDAQATDPYYWASHLRRPVQFSAGLSTLLEQRDQVFLEVGPGQTLAAFARRHPERETGVPVISSGGRHRDPAADHESLLMSVGRLWAAGMPLDWNAFHAEQERGHVPLPTYPFEARHYWIEPGQPRLSSRSARGSAKLSTDQWYSVPVWKQAYGTVADPDPEPAAISSVPDRWLLFADDHGVADQLAGAQSVIRVVAADAFGRRPDGGYEIRPDSEEDHAALITDLLAVGGLPARIVHCWSAGPLPAPPESAGAQERIERFETIQRYGLYSLIALVKALSAGDVTAAVAIDVISSGTYAVTDQDPEAVAERVPLAVAVKVIGQEHENLRCRHFDLPLVADPASLRTLVGELAQTRRPEVATAIRGRTRWVTELEPLATDWQAPRAQRLRQGGVYLITGGLGEIGSTVGGMLARDFGARLALLNRDQLPGRVDQDEWLDTHPADDETCLRIGRLRALEKAGAEVLLVTADVADETAMEAAIQQVEKHYGVLNGVVHAAGLPGEQWDRAVTAASVEQCRWHFVPKVYGQMVLERVLAERDVDFCLLLSSLAGVLGGLRLLGYGAANHFMDAAAVRANQRLDRSVWLSIGWDVWQHHQDEKRAISGIGRVMDDKAIQPEEGLETIKRLLSLTDTGQVAVSTWDLQHRLDQWVRRDHGRLPAPESAAGRAAAGDQGQLGEQVLAMIRDALGSPEMSEDADVFDFGGDSLLIVRLLSQIRTAHGVDLPLADVLSRPTPEAITALIADRQGVAAGDRTVELADLLAGLAALPADQAEQMLAEIERA